MPEQQTERIELVTPLISRIFELALERRRIKPRWQDCPTHVYVPVEFEGRLCDEMNDCLKRGMHVVVPPGLSGYGKYRLFGMSVSFLMDIVEMKVA